jgi:hypothetical protein
MTTGGTSTGAASTERTVITVGRGMTVTIDLPTRARWFALAAAMVATLGLAGCGGGGDSGATFEIGVTVAGQPLPGMQIRPGSVTNVAIRAGESIELDASEPVAWTLLVAGTSITGSGTTVYYAGATITQNEVSNSRIVVDTWAEQWLPAPVPITFVATSTLDAAVVATVNVLITN